MPKRSLGTITISTTISLELWQKCQKNNIKWAEALRYGATFLLSRKGVEEYQNPIQSSRKIEILSEKLAEMVAEKNQIEEQLDIMRRKNR